MQVRKLTPKYFTIAAKVKFLLTLTDNLNYKCSV